MWIDDDTRAMGQWKKARMKLSQILANIIQDLNVYGFALWFWKLFPSPKTSRPGAPIDWQNRTLWGPHFYSVSRNLGFLKITLCSSFRFDLFYHGPSKSFLAKKIGCDRSSDLDITVDAVIFPYAMGLSVRGGVEKKKKIARPPPPSDPPPLK